jgi:NAD(P)H-dependent FMN reductase
VIDWLSRVEPGKTFMAKPLLLLSASPGPNGGRTNLDNMATLAPWWGAEVVATFSLGNFYAVFDQETGARREDASAEGLDSALALFMAAL